MNLRGARVHSTVYLLLIITFFLTWANNAQCGVNVGNKYLFLTKSMRSTPLTISNPKNETIEVWLNAKFGYLVSGDNGQPLILYDSSGSQPQSAAEWIDMFPKRFKLGPMESQVVRITATPPPGLADGEYWARIIIASQSTKPSPILVDKTKRKGGIELIEQIGVPFHYRQGSVVTGLNIQNLNAVADAKSIRISMEMTRKGNASYWGTVIFRLYDNERRMLLKETKDVVIYTAFNPVFSIDRKQVPSGQYSLEVEFKTEGRKDVRRTDLIQDAPTRLTKDLTIE